MSLDGLPIETKIALMSKSRASSEISYNKPLIDEERYQSQGKLIYDDDPYEIIPHGFSYDESIEEKKEKKSKLKRYNSHTVND